MRPRGTPFRACLSGGFMATADGVRVLEFNARFADPESMNVLPLFAGDFAEACAQIASGGLTTKWTFHRKATVCKYVVPVGYGARAVAGRPLTGRAKGLAATGAPVDYCTREARDAP